MRLLPIPLGNYRGQLNMPDELLFVAESSMLEAGESLRPPVVSEQIVNVQNSPIS